MKLNMQGTIKKPVPERRFGFIQDEKGRQVFFHHSFLQALDFDDLFEGQAVTFEVEYGEKGLLARKVQEAIKVEDKGAHKIVIERRSNFVDRSELSRKIAADVKSLPDTRKAWIYEESGGSIECLTGGPILFWKEIIAVWIPVVCGAGAYLGKKAVDVLCDIAKARLMEKKDTEDVLYIEIYGPSGEIVKRFKAPRK
jgi:CspA family cold shock protein